MQLASQLLLEPEGTSPRSHTHDSFSIDNLSKLPINQQVSPDILPQTLM